MGRMYDTSSKSKYSPLSNKKLVEAARNSASVDSVNQSVSVPDPVDSRIVVDIGSLEIEEGR